MQKRTIEQIDKEIEQTKAELENVHGTETEVYARIVGYYRAVKNWNKGKRDEFDTRKLFTLEGDSYTVTEADADCPCGAVERVEKTQDYDENQNSDEIVFGNGYYEFFSRKTCPNCPAVRDFMQHIPMKGIAIDVDTQEGLSRAASKGVFAAPTVIVYNANGEEVARAHTTEELEVIFSEVLVANQVA